MPADRKDGSTIPARLRIVAWMLFTVALGLIAMIVSVRSTLVADISHEANDEVVQEIAELRRFAEVGVDPATSQPFASSQRFVEVYLGRQQLAAHEALIVYVHATGEAHAITGTAVPQLDLTSTNPLFVQMVQTGSGAAERGKGEVRWARVELQPNVPEQHLSVIAVSFTEPKLAQLNRVVLLMSGIGAAVLLFTGVIGMLVAGQILRPLRALRQAASSISEHDLTKRLPTQGRDDIAGLTESFNGMLDRLEDAFASQSQFILRANHELTGPLNRMDAQLAATPATPETRAQRAEIAGMIRMLEDLRILAQAERADFVRPHRKVAVDGLASLLAADLQALGGADWQVRLGASGTLTLDPQRIRQAIAHLARNAQQHGGDGPLVLEIRSAVDSQGRDCVEFAVTDRGPGIAPADVEWLFKRFTHGEASSSTRGAGLGLAIVRAIADAHDGTVFVDSVVGQGATFGLRIPAQLAPAPELVGAR